MCIHINIYDEKNVHLAAPVSIEDLKDSSCHDAENEPKTGHADYDAFVPTQNQKPCPMEIPGKKK